MMKPNNGPSFLAISITCATLTMSPIVGKAIFIPFLAKINPSHISECNGNKNDIVQKNKNKTHAHESLFQTSKRFPQSKKRPSINQLNPLPNTAGTGIKAITAPTPLPGYNYGPTIIRDSVLGRIDVWWCALDVPTTGRTPTDTIWHQKFDLSFMAVGSTEKVLVPSAPSDPYPWDSSFTCDPSVVKGQFKIPGDATNYTYAMYYGGTDEVDCADCPNSGHTRIGVAFSTTPDGANWKKYPGNPIISPQVWPPQGPNNYGVGQPGTYNADGIGGVQMLYTDTTASFVGRVFWTGSTDGIHFNKPTVVSEKGVTGVNGQMVNPDYAFDPVGRNWYALFSALDIRACASEVYQFGIYRMPETAFPNGTWERLGFINTARTGIEANHNPGIVRDPFGNTTLLPNIDVLYSAGKQANPETWEIFRATYNTATNTDELRRYYSTGISRHVVTPTPISPGLEPYPRPVTPLTWTNEGSPGKVFTGKQPGTIALFSCLNKNDITDQYISQKNCDLGCGVTGDIRLGIIGYIYPVSMPSTHEIFSCPTGFDHFVVRAGESCPLPTTSLGWALDP